MDWTQKNFHLIKEDKTIGHSHGKQWTDELVIQEIMRVVDSLGLGTFPTHREIENFYGNKGLTNKISKSGGTKYWANKTNLSIKDCESEFGDYYEKYSLTDILNNTGYKSYQNQVGYPYDITTNNYIKVDVKASSVVKKIKVINITLLTWKKKILLAIYLYYIASMKKAKYIRH